MGLQRVRHNWACTWYLNESYVKPRQHIKQRHHCADKGLYAFSSHHVWMWELNHKEGFAPKNWCFWAVVLEKILESPLDSKEIKPVSPKGNQPWIFIGRTDAEAEAPILWPPDVKSWLLGKEPDVGKDWRQEEMGKTKDEMVGWHHPLKGHEFGQTLGDSEGQGSLACCSPCGHRVRRDLVTGQEQQQQMCCNDQKFDYSGLAKWKLFFLNENFRQVIQRWYSSFKTSIFQTATIFLPPCTQPVV